jgi:glycosyltransferase involved in cell wall biosynthesis
MKIKKIIFDCERMKYPHTGLYHFCHQLGNAIRLNADEHLEQISYYVRETEHGAFGADSKYIAQHSLHKFWLPATGRYDIWHATFQSTQYFPFHRRIKIIFTVHDLNFLYDESKPEYKKLRELKKLQRKIDRADHIVAISEYTKNDILTHLNTRNKPLSVIYNGCNFKDIGEVIEPKNRPEGEFLFSIGTITDKKNFHVLPCLLKNNTLKLVLSGINQSQEYTNKIIAEAEQSGVRDRLIFTGPVSENDKQWYLKNCKAFVFPSLAEGFGLPVIEAMHFGKPVFLSTLTALPEIGGDVAYYFKNFDPEHMNHVLEEGLDHFSKFGDAGKVMERAKRFNWNDAAKAYLNLYRSVC